jgi:DNA processing protein
MAVPGSPLDPRSRGCNGLIRDGATLVQDAADVLEQLTGFDGSPRQAPALARRPSVPDEDAAAGECAPMLDARPLLATPADLATGVAALLGPAPVAVDELVRAAGVPSEAVQQALIELELAGRLVRHAGGRVSLNA